MTTTTKQRELIKKVAKLYYLDGWTQSQICKKIGLSRPVISKMLREAKEKHIVEIYIKDGTVHTVELERFLEKEYGLIEAVVVSGSHKNTEMTHRDMGQAASAYLAKKLNHIQSLGLSWGKSIYALAEEFQSNEQPHVHIVPLIGGMGQSHVEYHSNHVSFQLAQHLNARSSYVYAPAIADSAEMKQQLIQSKDVTTVLDEGNHVDFAIVGVGSVTEQTTAIDMGYLNAQDIQSLREAGAKGDLNSWFFDADGKIVEHPINDRIVALSPEQVRQIPEVMAIAEGEHKAESLHHALKAGLVNILVTNEQTAEHLLEKCSKHEHF